MPLNTRRILASVILSGILLAGCDIDPVDPSEVVTLTGWVVSAETGQPIPGAVVWTTPATAEVSTAADGSYAIPGVPGGYYTLSARAPGYRTATVSIAARSTRLADTLRLLDSIPRGGLVGYYPLDGSALDASGRGRHGAASGTVSTSDRFGRLDGAMLFDGRSSRIVVPSSSDLNFIASDFTVVAWIRFSDLQPHRPGIVARGTATTPFIGYELRITGGKAEAEVATTLGPVSTRNERFINDGRWHLVGFTGSRRNARLDFYVDGDLVDFTPSSNVNGDFSSSANLVIGQGASTGAYFNGAIDDVRIYSRRLDSEDFEMLYYERGYR